MIVCGFSVQTFNSRSAQLSYLVVFYFLSYPFNPARDITFSVKRHLHGRCC